MDTEHDEMREVKRFPLVKVPRWVIFLSVITTLVYFSWWLDFRHAGNWIFFGLLFIGEVYHVWQAFGYLHTIWDQKDLERVETTGVIPVDVLIPVCGEPVDVVERTLQAVTTLNYPNYKVFLLNDGYVAKKPNWRELEEMAQKYDVKVLRREEHAGGKPGNVNFGLRHTNAPLFALFDCDHVPHKEFLARTVGYFENNPKLAFVQTPQYYGNRNENYLTQGAWEQQELFFGPICQGKNRMNATFWCGTNAVLRREAIMEIGGVPENNIAEDFLASMLMHERGWKSIYIPDILSEGTTPNNLKDYVSQQFRWARGSLEIIFKYNPFFRKGLSFVQKMQYLYSAGYYLNGIIVVINALIPIAVILSGILPVRDETSNFMAYFFPFIFSTLYLLMRSTGFAITFRAIQLTMSSFPIFLNAAVSAMLNKKVAWKVTPKDGKSGNFLIFALPNIVYTILGVATIIFGLVRKGATPEILTNGAWIIFNIVFFFTFIKVAYPWGSLRERVGEYLVPVRRALVGVGRAYVILGGALKGERKRETP